MSFPCFPFSQRTAWPARTNPLTAHVAARRAAGQPLIDLAVSNPTVVGLPEPDLRALALPEGARYEPDAAGMASARKAIAEDYERHGVTVDPERLVLTASTSEAYAYLFWLLTDPGDEILVPAPSYPLFPFLADLTGVQLVPYPLRYDGGWHMDLPALRTAITARTRGVLVVSPNNPTGSYLKNDELAALRALAQTRGLALIADEVFFDYPFASDPRRAPTLAAETTGLAFALNGLSKLAALPQAKLAWIALAGEKNLVERTRERLGLIADTYLSVSTAVQLAAPTWLRQATLRREAIRQRTARNRMTLQTALASPSPATVLPTEGGWYATVRVPATQSAEQWALALVNEGVLVHPGHFYDFPNEAYLIVSLLPTAEDFAQGMRRWANIL